MNRLALILSGLAGLLVGLLGSRTGFLHRTGTGSATVAPTVTTPDNSAALSGHAQRGDGADDRLARLFSALQEPVELARRYALQEAVRDLPSAEFPALLARAAQVPADVRQPFTVALMIAWFEKGPAAAGAWMRSHPEQYHGVEAWARSDPDGAIREALAAPDLDRSERLLFCAIEKLAGKDPAAQAARLHEVPPGGLREQVFTDVLRKWAESNPRAALTAADGLPPGAPRDDARQQVILAWAAKDPANALAQVSALLPTLNPQLIGHPFLTKLAERVMEKDPRAGLAWIDTLPAEHRQSAAIAGLAAWGKREPVAALEWGLAHGIEVARGRYDGLDSWYRGVLATAVTEAPAATIAALESLPPGPRRTGLLERALCDFGWLPTGEKNSSATAGLVQRVLPQLSAEAQRTVAGSIGTMIGMQSSFAEIGAWSQLFPAGEVRDIAVGQAVIGAFNTDAKRSDRILATLAPSRERDAALVAVVPFMARRHPAGAASRALEIGDPQRRQKSLDAVLKEWRERDPAAVEAWQRGQKP